MVRKVIGVFNPLEVTHRRRVQMRNDPDIAFGTALIRAPIVNLRWSIESRDEEVSAFLDRVLRPRYRQLALAASRAIMYGFSVVEKCWASEPVTVYDEDKKTHAETTKRYPSAWRIARFKAIANETVKFVIDEAADDWSGIEQGQKGAKVVKVGKERAILWSFRRDDVDGALAGMPLYDQCYEPWYWDAALAMFTNRYFERKADPAYKGRAHPTLTINGQPVDGYEYLGQQALALRSGGYIGLPSVRDPQTKELLFDLELLADDKRGDMFDGRANVLSVKKLRGLLITDKAATNTGDTGTKSQAEVHQDVMGGMLEEILAEYVEEVVESQVLMDIATFNFGAERARDAAPRIKSAGLSGETKTIMADVFKAMIQAEQLAGSTAGQVSLLKRIDADAIMKQIGVPAKSAEEIDAMAAEDKKAADEQAKADAKAAAEAEKNIGNETALKPGQEDAIAAQMKARGTTQ